MSLNNRIREIRKTRELGLAELAERIGVSMSTMSKLETGQIQLTVAYIDKLARALNVPSMALLPRPDDDEAQSPIDASLLAEILATVRELLLAKKLDIDPAKHAAIVTRLYEEFLARNEATAIEIKREASNIIAYETLAQRQRK